MRNYLKTSQSSEMGMHVYTYVCMYVCMYGGRVVEMRSCQECVCVCVRVCIKRCAPAMSMCVYVCVCVCVYIKRCAPARNSQNLVL
jgi:hypothetical protein